MWVRCVVGEILLNWTAAGLGKTHNHSLLLSLSFLSVAAVHLYLLFWVSMISSGGCTVLLQSCRECRCALGIHSNVTKKEKQITDHHPSFTTSANRCLYSCTLIRCAGSCVSFHKQAIRWKQNQGHTAVQSYPPQSFHRTILWPLKIFYHLLKLISTSAGNLFQFNQVAAGSSYRQLKGLIMLKKLILYREFQYHFGKI